MSLNRSGLAAWIAAAFVFVITLLVSRAAVSEFDANMTHDRRELIQSTVSSHAQAIQRQLDRSLSATYALATLIRQGDGGLDDFDSVATDMIESYGGISALQLAPGAKVSASVPLKGNEKAIGHDLLKDPARRADVLRTISARKLTLAGPVELLQGGVAVIGRNPVFIVDDTGKSRFWGLTIALIRMDDLMDSLDLESMEKGGLEWQLWRTHPDTGKRQVFAGSSPEGTPDALVDPVSFVVEVPNGQWALSAAPIEGWTASGSGAVGTLLPWVIAGSTGLLIGLMLSRSSRLDQLVKVRTSELERSLVDKEILLKEVHHRVKNNLQVVWSLLSLQARSVTDEAAKRALEDSQSRIRVMSLVHEKLVQKVDLSSFSFRDYLSGLIGELVTANRPAVADVDVTSDLDDISIDIDRAITCGLILNELLTNALTHGVLRGAPGQVAVSLKLQPDGRVRLMVEDDGPGLGDPASGSAGLGMQLVTSLASQLDGAVHVTSEGGAHVGVTFKV